MNTTENIGGLTVQIINMIRRQLAKNPRITRAVLFGSRAKGNFKEGSDIDLSLEGDLTSKDILELGAWFDELPILNKIDLVLYHSITEPELTAHINRVGIEFYKK